MWRRGVMSDAGGIIKCYVELLDYEAKHGANTVWKKGVYPTEKTALEGIASGNMYVFDEAGDILASVIIDSCQPAEYETVPWNCNAGTGEVVVMHTLCVSPQAGGRGIGAGAVRLAVDLGRKNGKKTIRLDTGKQNIPAIKLYEKMGFHKAGEGHIFLGREIHNSRQLFFELPL